MRTPAELDKLTSEFHAVLVHIDAIDFDQSTPLEDELTELLAPTEIGYHDGNEVGQGQTTLWLFGVNADELFEFVEPTLRRNPFSRNARVVLRYGQSGSPEREVRL